MSIFNTAGTTSNVVSPLPSPKKLRSKDSEDGIGGAGAGAGADGKTSSKKKLRGDVKSGENVNVNANNVDTSLTKTKLNEIQDDIVELDAAPARASGRTSTSAASRNSGRRASDSNVRALRGLDSADADRDFFESKLKNIEEDKALL